jgi:hypothetical protein
MLRATSIRSRRALGREQGFTLIELLVVMVAGIVVISALFTIVEVTLRQTTRTFSTIDASQHARIGVDQVENELHSACVGTGVTPIQVGSNGTSLIFISQSGSTASPANGANPIPVLHTITFNAGLATLTDTTTAVSAGVSPNWTFAGASSTRTILTNVAPSGATPTFQYFAYAEPFSAPGVPYVDGAGNTYEMLIDGIDAVPGTSTVLAAAPLTVPLVLSDAQNAAEVLIKFVVGPSGGSNQNTNLNAAKATVADQVVLRLTPAANHDGSGASFDPCQ